MYFDFYNFSTHPYKDCLPQDRLQLLPASQHWDGRVSSVLQFLYRPEYVGGMVRYLESQQPARDSVYLVKRILSLLDQSSSRPFSCGSDSAKYTSLLLQLFFRENLHCLQCEKHEWISLTSETENWHSECPHPHCRPAWLCCRSPDQPCLGDKVITFSEYII